MLVGVDSHPSYYFFIIFSLIIVATRISNFSRSRPLSLFFGAYVHLYLTACDRPFCSTIEFRFSSFSKELDSIARRSHV